MPPAHVKRNASENRARGNKQFDLILVVASRRAARIVSARPLSSIISHAPHSSSKSRMASNILIVRGDKLAVLTRLPGASRSLARASIALIIMQKVSSIITAIAQLSSARAHSALFARATTCIFRNKSKSCPSAATRAADQPSATTYRNRREAL